MADILININQKLDGYNAEKLEDILRDCLEEFGLHSFTIVSTITGNTTTPLVGEGE